MQIDIYQGMQRMNVSGEMDSPNYSLNAPDFLNNYSVESSW